MAKQVGLVFVLVVTTATAAIPRLTPAQAVALFRTAGLPLGADKYPVNRCGQRANPKVAFVDMNDDQRPEALFIDQGGCYRPDGRWYAIATENSDGSWWRALDGEGSIAATGTAFNGWFVLNATSGGTTTRLHYNGTTYVPADNSRPRSTAANAVSGYPTDGWKASTAFTALPPAAQASIMRAAGLKLDGETWKGCDGTSAVGKDGVKIKDLNGDGRPEVIVTDAGYACYGNTGQRFTVLVAVPGGWRAVMQEVGIPELLKSRGPDNYPDIQVGGPGTCWAVDRWNGKRYAYIGRRYDPGGPEAGKPCKF